MLTEFFMDWWFAPWTYAAVPDFLPEAADHIGQRDGYRLWCAQVHVAPDFSADFEPAWHVAAMSEGQALMKAAALFAGLIAARARDLPALNPLPLPDRRWCMSVAMTQPLIASVQSPPAGLTLQARGLLELATRLQRDFPGMWSRLRLLLPQAVANEVDALLAPAASGGDFNIASAARARRCWALCRDRALAA